MRLIASGGGTNLASALIVSVVLIVPLIVVVENSIAISIRSYQTRHAKEKIDQHLLLGERYKGGLEAYFTRNGRWPASTADLDDSIPRLSAHNEYIVTKGGGELIIKFTDIKGYNNGSISLLPTIRPGRIEWTCLGKGMERRHLPVRCRN